MKNLGILGAIFGMALSARSPRLKGNTFAARLRRSSPESKSNPNAPSFGDKLARKALKGRIGTCHGTGYVAKAHELKRRAAKRQKAVSK